MAINEENLSAELPEDDQLNDEFLDTNSLALGKDKNTPIGVRGAGDIESFAAQRIDKNTPIG